MDKKLGIALDVLASLGNCAKKLKQQGHLTVKDVQDVINELYKSVKGTDLENVKLIDITDQETNNDSKTPVPNTDSRQQNIP